MSIGETPLSPALPASCGRCAFLRPCGGLQQIGIFGCFEDCFTKCRSGQEPCDWTCPHRPDFVARFREVGGFDREVGPILPITAESLPLYVPMVRHRFRRAYCLTTKVVALSIREIFKSRWGYRPVATTADGLRDYFGIRRDAQVLIVSVASDPYLERYWHHEEKVNISAHLVPLGVVGMTVPNFSFFEDAPRTHTLWNRARMMRVAERLSAAGVAVAPHVNALVAEDWDYWATLLRARPGIRYITKEFQTGLRDDRLAAQAIRDLAELQRRVRRDLHPIIVGGSRHAKTLRKEFRHITFADSAPFMKTYHRRMAIRRGNELVWEKRITEKHAPLDDLLESNIRTYGEHLTAQAC